MMACPACGKDIGVVTESQNAFQHGTKIVGAKTYRTKCAACGHEYMTAAQRTANEAAITAAVKEK